MVGAVAQECTQVCNDMLQRRAAVLLALELEVSFDVASRQGTKTAIRRLTSRNEVGDRRAVVFQRIGAKSSYFGQLALIAAAQDTQRVIMLLDTQLVGCGQKPRKDAASAQVQIGICLGDYKRVPHVRLKEHLPRPKTIRPVDLSYSS